MYRFYCPRDAEGRIKFQQLMRFITPILDFSPPYGGLVVCSECYMPAEYGVPPSPLEQLAKAAE